MAAVPFGLTSYPLGQLVITDVNLYAAWARLLSSGVFPVFDPMWQYPPLAAPLFMISATGDNPQRMFMAVALIADALALLALLLGARRSGRLAGAWLWAAAAGIIGPVFLTRFDVFPTTAVMIGLLLVATRPFWAGAAVGLGAALKVWPVLALAALRRADLPRGVAGFFSVIVLTSAAMWAWFGESAWSFLSGQSERGLQIESTAALPFVLAHAGGADIAVRYRYGSMEVDMPGAGMAAMLTTVIGLLLLCSIAWARLSGRLERVPGPDVAFAAVLVSVVFSRVFSPQYSIWLVGIAAVCLTGANSRMQTPAVLVAVAAVLTQAIFPPLYTELIYGEVLPAALQTARIVLVVTAMVLALRSIWRGAGGPRRSAQASGSRPSSSIVNRAEISSQRQERSIQARPA